MICSLWIRKQNSKCPLSSTCKIWHQFQATIAQFQHYWHFSQNTTFTSPHDRSNNFLRRFVQPGSHHHAAVFVLKDKCPNISSNFCKFSAISATFLLRVTSSNCATADHGFPYWGLKHCNQTIDQSLQQNASNCQNKEEARLGLIHPNQSVLLPFMKRAPISLLFAFKKLSFPMFHTLQGPYLTSYCQSVLIGPWGFKL